MELGILAKEKEMEVLEENHRVEVRVSALRFGPATQAKRHETPPALCAGVRPKSEAPGV